MRLHLAEDHGTPIVEAERLVLRRTDDEVGRPQLGLRRCRRHADQDQRGEHDGNQKSCTPDRTTLDALERNRHGLPLFLGTLALHPKGGVRALE